MCVCVCVHPDSKLRAMVKTSDCKAGGRGTHTDSSANKAGLYAVRIPLRTVSDRTCLWKWQPGQTTNLASRGQGYMSVAAKMLSGTCPVRVRAFRYTHPEQDLPQKM